jgi:hypothetical protein
MGSASGTTIGATLASGSAIGATIGATLASDSTLASGATIGATLATGATLRSGSTLTTGSATGATTGSATDSEGSEGTDGIADANTSLYKLVFEFDESVDSVDILFIVSYFIFFINPSLQKGKGLSIITIYNT